jgi:hypothetical protein
MIEMVIDLLEDLLLLFLSLWHKQERQVED